MRAVIILLSFLLLITPAYAGDIKLHTKHILIPIGGNNTTSFTITLNESDGIGKYHTIFIEFYKNGDLTDKITGELTSDDVQLEKKISEKPEILKYKYYAPRAGSYNFTLKLWFNRSVKVGETFDISIDDKYIVGSTPKMLATAYVDAEAVPELTTAILTGIGIGLLLLIRKF